MLVKTEKESKELYPAGLVNLANWAIYLQMKSTVDIFPGNAHWNEEF